jgi:hypothetical protein
MHAISSSLKPKSSWFTTQVITESRSICGGFGFSSFSRLPDLLSEN